MFMIREILGYCIISAIGIACMAVLLCTCLLFTEKTGAPKEADCLFSVWSLCNYGSRCNSRGWCDRNGCG